ncbi:MAG: hypothetical protein U0269_34915 [Polyangiales bacterium]
MASVRALTAASLVLTLAGCSDAVQPTDPDRAVYVGRIAGSDLALGVVVEDGALVAYLCGGPSTLESHTSWLDGASRGASLSAQGPRASLSAVANGQRVDGTLVDSQGVRWAFSLARAADGSRAGLYESREGACRTGVILFDAETGAAQGAGCDGQGRRSQVTPVRPMTVSTSGLAAQATLAPERVLYVRPVRPALTQR